MFLFFLLLGPPQIISSGAMIVRPRGDNTTLDCQYSANPLERSYKWQRPDKIILLDTSDQHYTVTQHTLTIHNITPVDASLYTCNVTNQCGSGTVFYTLDIIGKCHTVHT